MRWLVTATCLVLFACGRLGFTPGDGASDPSGDGGLGDGRGPDVTFGNCWSAWTVGPLTLSAPQPMTVLNTPDIENDVSLAADALSMFFASGPLDHDIFYARRPDRASPFEPRQLRTDLSSAADDSKVSVTADGLIAVIASTRAGSMGYDLWELARATPDGVFMGASQTPLAQVNDNMSQYDPHLSSDGLRLYYAPQTAAGQVIRLATRSSPVAPFGAPTLVTDLGSNLNADPHLSPDELVIVYSASPNMAMPLNLYYATRTSTGAPFANARPVPDVGISTSVLDQDPMLSYDGCELFFTSTRSGMSDLYVSVVQ